jgi:ankyrin repeat protein
LLFAALRGNSEVIEALLLHGVDVDARDKYGVSAIQFCMESSNQHCVDVLASRGAELPTFGFSLSAEVWRKREEFMNQKRSALS